MIFASPNQRKTPHAIFEENEDVVCMILFAIGKFCYSDWNIVIADLIVGKIVCVSCEYLDSEL